MSVSAGGAGWAADPLQSFAVPLLAREETECPLEVREYETVACSQPYTGVHPSEPVVNITESLRYTQ